MLSAIVVPPAVRVGMGQIYLRHAGRPDPPRLPPIRSGTVHDVPVDVTGPRTWGQAAVTMRQRRFQVLWIGNPEVPNRVRLGDEPVAEDMWERSPGLRGRNRPLGGSVRRDWMLCPVKAQGGSTREQLVPRATLSRTPGKE